MIGTCRSMCPDSEIQISIPVFQHYSYQNVKPRPLLNCLTFPKQTWRSSKHNFHWLNMFSSYISQQSVWCNSEQRDADNGYGDLRERENLLHPFEIDGTYKYDKTYRPKANAKKCVKEYRRPTVGKQEVISGDVRPPDVLVNTVHYLIDRITTDQYRWTEIYDFVFDRLRSIRQDLVIQDVHGAKAISIWERAVRFHIFSDYRLCREHMAVFDQKINDQHTLECLKRVVNLYSEDSELVWRNRVEMETVYLLFNLGNLQALRHYYSLDVTLRHSPDLELAYKMSCAYLHNNWVRVFRDLSKLESPLYLCAVHRHFPFIQRNALFTMNSAYSSKNIKFPLERLKQILCLNTDTEAQILCHQFGITIDGTVAHFQKSNFKNEEQVERRHCDFITDSLRQWTVPDILHGQINLDLELTQSFQDKCQT